MVTDGQLWYWITIWLLIGLVLLYVRLRYGAGVGLVVAFGLQMMMLHWLAAAIYVLPWYWNLDLRVVFAGLRESTWAIGGFTAGVIAVTALRHRQVEEQTSHDASVDQKIVKLYLAVGVVAYFVLPRFLGSLPTVGALVNMASTCAIVGIALACWNADHSRNRGALWWWLLIAGLLPFVTIAVQGFMGYGLAAAVVIFSFVGSFYRPAWKTAVVSLIGAYIGMSLYVTYMRDRQDIREVVWGGESASARISRLQDTFLNLELFDIHNIDHLQRVDLRLNQNYLVGMAVQYLDTHPNAFANGETIVEALLAPIPRALWPDKPSAAGSGNLVSRFTGMQFDETTSVGIGQVMEMYVNFASAGVFLGFLVLGVIITYVDAEAARYREARDWHRFTLWFLPGLSLLQLGGSLVEVTSSAAAAIAVAVLLNRFAPISRRKFVPSTDRRRRIAVIQH